MQPSTVLGKAMSEFWWHKACPQPDGWFNLTFQWKGGPYAWTAGWHQPWYWLGHPGERWRFRNGMPWWRFATSILAIPFGLGIWGVKRLLKKRVDVLMPPEAGVP